MGCLAEKSVRHGMVCICRLQSPSDHRPARFVVQHPRSFIQLGIQGALRAGTNALLLGVAARHMHSGDGTGTELSIKARLETRDAIATKDYSATGL